MQPCFAAYAIVALTLTLLTTPVVALVEGDTESAAQTLGASFVTEVFFTKGQSTLTESRRAELEEFIQRARKDGKIKEVRVVAWSDKEYPRYQRQYTDADIELAEKRARAVEQVFKDFKLKKVETFNMARRPNTLEEWLQTTNAKVKKTMESSGAAPHAGEKTGLFGEKAKSSSAMILIYR